VTSKIELRTYQIKAREDIRAAYENGIKSICFQLPCGGGKTVIFTDIVARTYMASTRTVIIVHRDTLLLQASRKLNEYGIRHGIIAPGFPRTYDLIQIASIQTLVRRDNTFDFIIIDEAHHALADSYTKVIERNPEAHILGVTATPMRTNGSGLNKIFEHLICGPSVAKLTEQGYLVPSKVYGPARALDLSSIHTRSGDYAQDELAMVMDKPTITGNAVSEYRRLCNGAAAVAFTVSIQHAIDVCAEFNAAGYHAEYISGKMHKSIIRDHIAGLENGRIQVLTSCDLISEGMDVPAVRAAILLRPTKSTTLYMQQVGRVLRPYPGKDHAIILDHAGNYLRHGLPDEERKWTLEGRAKGTHNTSVKTCPMCYAAHKPAPVCPMCGHVYSTAGGRDVTQVDGELTEINPHYKRQMIANARTYQELRAVARQLGYKPGWAYHTALRRGIAINAR
jgi:DNA repair protein RadD